MSTAGIKHWLNVAAQDGHITKEEMKQALSREDRTWEDPVSIGSALDYREVGYLKRVKKAVEEDGTTRMEMIFLAAIDGGSEGRQRMESVTKNGVSYVRRAALGLPNKDLPGLRNQVGFEEGAVEELNQFLLSNDEDDSTKSMQKLVLGAGVGTGIGLVLGGPAGALVGFVLGGLTGDIWGYLDD